MAGGELSFLMPFLQFSMCSTFKSGLVACCIQTKSVSTLVEQYAAALLCAAQEVLQAAGGKTPLQVTRYLKFGMDEYASLVDAMARVKETAHWSATFAPSVIRAAACHL